MKITKIKKHAVARFDLGRTLATRGAIDLMERAGIPYITLFRRHALCDWGDISPDGIIANNIAAATGSGRILSSYAVDDAQLWVITEADRSTTTILLPEEY